jgi:hypothetical protein
MKIIRSSDVSEYYINSPFPLKHMILEVFLCEDISIIDQISLDIYLINGKKQIRKS